MTGMTGPMLLRRTHHLVSLIYLFALCWLVPVPLVSVPLGSVLLGSVIEQLAVLKYRLVLIGHELARYSEGSLGQQGRRRR